MNTIPSLASTLGLRATYSCGMWSLSLGDWHIAEFDNNADVIRWLDIYGKIKRVTS